MTIFFSVGEPSGDLHAANLIRELQRQRPGIRCTGYGGPQMRAAGCTLHADLTALAVMWLLRVLLNLHKFVGLLNRADRYLCLLAQTFAAARALLFTQCRLLKGKTAARR